MTESPRSPAGPATDRIVPGCEPFAFEGGPAGVLMLHGFTGNPASLRRAGQWLADRGHAVACPLYPGHGTHWRDLTTTRWQQWERAAERGLEELAARSETVIAFGLSVGGAMALHLAARHPQAIRGVVAVNPYVLDRRISGAFLIWPVVRTWKGIGDDIRKEGETELPYDRIPMRGLAELARFIKVVRKELPRVQQPLLVFSSREDHVVPKASTEFVMERAGSGDKELVELPNSYHVATLDHDADTIFQRTHEFVQAHAVPGGERS